MHTTMNVFVTSATGWIGSAVAEELLGHGHEITASSDATRAALTWTPEGPGLLEDLAAGTYTAR